MQLFAKLSRHLASGALHELTLTTNGSQLDRFADELAAHGVERVNVSLDTLDAAKFGVITRWGDFDRVVDGLAAARRAGLKVKINAVALKGVNEDELADMVAWSHDRGMEITFIEVMPLGEEGGDRSDQFLSLEEVRHRLADRFTLEPLSISTGGPARYARVAETGGRVGFITPLTHNFCESCNRVRVTCTGTLYMCLGQNDAADLRAALRSADPDAALDAAIAEAISRKPKGHDFVADRLAAKPRVGRMMSTTGG